MTNTNILWFKSVMNSDFTVYDYLVWKGGVDCLYIKPSPCPPLPINTNSLVVCVYSDWRPINNNSYHSPPTRGVPGSSAYAQVESGASTHILGMYLPLLTTFNKVCYLLHPFCLVGHLVTHSFSDLCWIPTHSVPVLWVDWMSPLEQTVISSEGQCLSLSPQTGSH